MKHRLQTALLCIATLSTAACESSGGLTPSLNGLGEWYLLNSCSRMQSNCPGVAKVPPGAYKVVGRTVLWGEPVQGELYAYENKTLATGRLYKSTQNMGGMQFEGAWIDDCTAEGRSSNQSTVWRLTRVECLSQKELDKFKR